MNARGLVDCIGLRLLKSFDRFVRQTRDGTEVEIAGKTYPAMASMKPLYDPTSERVKA